MIILCPYLCSITSRTIARSVTRCGLARRTSAGSPACARRPGNEPDGATCGCPATSATTSSGRPRSTSRRTTSPTTRPGPDRQRASAPVPPSQPPCGPVRSAAPSAEPLGRCDCVASPPDSLPLPYRRRSPGSAGLRYPVCKSHWPSWPPIPALVPGARCGSGPARQAARGPRPGRPPDGLLGCADLALPWPRPAGHRPRHGGRRVCAEPGHAAGCGGYRGGCVRGWTATRRWRPACARAFI